MSLPYTIQAIFQQLGGTGLQGAIVYCGGSNLVYKDEGPKRSSLDEHGFLTWGTGLKFKVNGKRGQTWKMVVAYEPDDTYTVYLLRVYTARQIAKTGFASDVLGQAGDVYCDTLQGTVERLYDEAIAKHCGGFVAC